MGIWVRSQDKEILKECKFFEIEISDNCESYNIYADGEHLIGIYSTKEKALKVLDMIDLFKNQPLQIEKLKSLYIHNYEKTFQMPQESKVE